MHRLLELLLAVVVLAVAWAYTPAVVALVVTVLVLIWFLGSLKRPGWRL